MTEANMKKLYEHYVATGQHERAQKILDIPRYSKFAANKTSMPEEKPKSKKEK